MFISESINHFNPRLNYYWLWGIQLGSSYKMWNDDTRQLFTDRT